MKAVVRQVSDAELEQRRRRGLDRFDEMWDGVLHMAPSPLYEHQRMVSFVAKGREQILARDGIRGGGPDAVIEIHSPPYLAVQTDAADWLRSDVLKARVAHRDSDHVVIEDVDDATTHSVI